MEKNLNLFDVRHSLTYNFIDNSTRIKTADRWGQSPGGCREFKDAEVFSYRPVLHPKL
jgi:hypothetical protein